MNRPRRKQSDRIFSTDFFLEKLLKFCTKEFKLRKLYSILVAKIKKKQRTWHNKQEHKC